MRLHGPVSGVTSITQEDVDLMDAVAILSTKWHEINREPHDPDKPEQGYGLTWLAHAVRYLLRTRR